MQPSEIEGILSFLREAERLKNVHRSSWTSGGEPESVAQHTWRLTLMAMLFAEAYPSVDFARLVKICIVHDLGEAIRGDVPAVEQEPDDGRAERERADLRRLVAPLPDRLADEIVALWEEYEGAATPEARLAKALDKLETILQHNQGDNPSDFDYRFNLDYGKRYTTGDPLVERVRSVLDRETRRRAQAAEDDG